MCLAPSICALKYAPCAFSIGEFPTEIEVGVRRLILLSNLLYCNTIIINQILNIKIDLLSIASKFKIAFNPLNRPTFENL